ncbi:MAG: Gfo/Idh/MocA family protein [Propioniciclava sp.]
MTQPLTIGILGAARIAARAVIHPARANGAEVLAVAARDQGRAARYATQHGIERAYGSYAEMLADADLDVVYNPSPNSEHVRWTLAALRAGKHVLSEKPFAANAAQARLVAAETNDRLAVDGYHHRYHPAHRRLMDLVASGAIGEVTGLHVNMKFNCEDLNDIRWSWPLAGGSLMDLGGYALHVAKDIAHALGGTLALHGCTTTSNPGADPRIDATASVTGTLPGGGTVTLESSLESPRDTSILVTGTGGTIRQPNFIQVSTDDRLIVTIGDQETVEHHGTISSYTHQFAALTATLMHGAPYPTGIDNAIQVLELIDQCYQMAGLPLRESEPFT